MEIKSSATFSTDFVSGIRHFRSVFPDISEPGYVLFNGEAEPNAEYDGVRIVNLVRRCPFYN